MRWRCKAVRTSRTASKDRTVKLWDTETGESDAVERHGDIAEDDKGAEDGGGDGDDSPDAGLHALGEAAEEHGGGAGAAAFKPAPPRGRYFCALISLRRTV